MTVSESKESEGANAICVAHARPLLVGIVRDSKENDVKIRVVSPRYIGIDYRLYPAGHHHTDRGIDWYKIVPAVDCVNCNATTSNDFASLIGEVLKAAE